ncbi:hypothetical protein BRADI_3g34860v3 [Brachypodium distachyon]|uniref:RRM domain-containing protein n=1 Tax=Brachypodium distachyon TaxID=15368 RepID=A0A0Q3Q8Y5_BRADI|nr:hypothetical protein BRADI_3g34860v3 [Brachypodium distachyon]KQJ98091.1 hypothetical protein BRADI_3g34860v3 [Brachypodium distachyon]PNT68027.1 hypothetical protein BRADI_3g34860v3 [Brachypodium distachyon]
MSQLKEVRYTARSITPPLNRNGSSKSPPPVRRSASRSPPPKRNASRSPRPGRHSTSGSPRPRGRGRSRSRDRSPSRDKSEDDLRNPGNNLYVTGLSTRVTEAELEKFFSTEGKVKNCHVVLDPRTKESRGFAFVSMDTVEDARRCIKRLHRTVLEGRLVTVEKFAWCSTASTSTWLVHAMLTACAAVLLVLITTPTAFFFTACRLHLPHQHCLPSLHQPEGCCHLAILES